MHNGFPQQFVDVVGWVRRPHRSKSYNSSRQLLPLFTAVAMTRLRKINRIGLAYTAAPYSLNVPRCRISFGRFGQINLVYDFVPCPDDGEGAPAPPGASGSGAIVAIRYPSSTAVSG